jgi:hypothetical protein
VSTTYEINIGGVPYHSAAEIARTHGYSATTSLASAGKARCGVVGSASFGMWTPNRLQPSSTAMMIPPHGTHLHPWYETSPPRCRLTFVR